MMECRLLHVAIDPGHGGDNSGASCEGFIEKDHVLDVAFRLERACKGAIHNHVETYLTRYEDETVSFCDRNHDCKQHHVDLVMSLHVDASENSDYSGTHVMYYPGNETTKMVASSIREALPAVMRWQFRGPVPATPKEWPRANYLMRQYNADVVLVELGFLTNENDRRLMVNESIIDTTILAMMRGMMRMKHLITAT